MKKLIAASLIALLAVGLIFANGSAETSKEKVKTLDMFWWSDGNEGKVMQSLIDEYEAMHPEVHINMIEIPFNDMSNKIMMSVAGGEAPAITRTTEGISNSCYEAFVDIGQYTDAEALIAQYIPSIESYYVKNGAVISIPSDVTANGLIYNKTMFDKAGVKIPTGPDDIWTWEEFEAALKKVKEVNGLEYAMAIDNATHRWATMLYEFGGSFANENGGNLGSPESRDCIETTLRLFKEKVINPSPWITFEDAGILFRGGLVACQLSGTWEMQNYNANIKDFEWGVTYMPKKVMRSSVPGGKQLAAVQGSGVEKEAVEFILWVTDKEQSKRYCEESMFVSPRLDCASLDYEFCSDYFAIFANELANTSSAAAFDWGYPGLSAAFAVDATYDWPKLISGEMSVDEFITKIDGNSTKHILGK